MPDPAAGGALVNPRYEYKHTVGGGEAEIIDSLGRKTAFSHDGMGRQTSRTLPLGVGASGSTEQFQYDSRDRHVLHVSFAGAVAQSIYHDGANGTGRIVEQKFFSSLAAYTGGAGTPTDCIQYQRLSASLASEPQRRVFDPDEF